MSIEKNNNKDLWKKAAIGVGVAAGVTAEVVLAKRGGFKKLSDYILTRGKNLLSIMNLLIPNMVLKLDNSFKNIIPTPVRHTYYRGISGQNYGTQVINEAKNR